MATIPRNRVRSYFQQGRPFHPKLEALVKRIADLEFIKIAKINFCQNK
jgi:excinuclease UvrABC nuclease subunit